jgi:hypothetical protein
MATKKKVKKKVTPKKEPKTESVEAESVVDEAPLTEAEAKLEVKKMASGMKKKLDARKQVSVRVPLDQLNPKERIVTVQINGYTYTIERGKDVTVPDVVKDILEEAKLI